MRVASLITILFFTAVLVLVLGCKTRKETQKETNNSPADTNIQASGKTVLNTDTMPNLFTDADNGKKAMLKKGDTFNLLLEANMTTGYTWVIANTDSAIVKKVAENYFTQNNAQPMAGAVGKQWYAFKTLAPGTVQLKLDYKRPWEAKTPPALTFELGIEVK